MKKVPVAHPLRSGSFASYFTFVQILEMGMLTSKHFELPQVLKSQLSQKICVFLICSKKHFKCWF